MNSTSLGSTLMILLASLLLAQAQTELASIPLNPALGKVQKVRHFHDDEGNVLFNFMKGEYSQFSLLKGDTLASSKTLYIPGKNRFLEAIFIVDSLTLFYRNNKAKDVYVYQSDMQTLPGYVVNAGTRQHKERALVDVYHRGDFLTINFTRKPFTLHTYRHNGDQTFEKGQQVFADSKSGNWWLGQIKTDDEIIFVRFSGNTLTLNFYRYFKDRGFEKISVPLSALYQETGLNYSVALDMDYGDYYKANRRLDAFVEGDDIYLDLSKFMTFVPRKSDEDQLSAGVLHLNWMTNEPRLLSFDTPNDNVFYNRKFDLLDNRYYKLLVSQNKLELSIYAVDSQTLLKSYSYSLNQHIDLIYGFANLRKRVHGNLRLTNSISIPSSVRYRNKEGLDTEELLNILSSESLSFGVKNNGDEISLQVSGTDNKGVWVDKSVTASFVGFLNADDLEIIKEEDALEVPIDPIFMRVDEYIAQLEEDGQLGYYDTFYHNDKVHLAYIDKNLNCCKIIVFD